MREGRKGGKREGRRKEGGRERRKEGWKGGKNRCLGNHLRSKKSRQMQLISRIHLHSSFTKTELMSIEFI